MSSIHIESFPITRRGFDIFISEIAPATAEQWRKVDSLNVTLWRSQHLKLRAKNIQQQRSQKQCSS